MATNGRATGSRAGGVAGFKAAPAAARLSPDEIARRIQGYTPRDIPLPRWLTIRPFVIEALLAAEPVGEASMERYARCLALIANWCVDEGIALDVELALDPDTVERFCARGLKKLRSWGSYRSTLRRLGRELTTKAPWEPRPRPMPGRRTAPPYTAAEVAALRQDAERQSTPGRRRAATALIVLGAGAGLDGRWSRRVRGTDVVRIDGVVVVRVGPPSSRAVPVLAEYEDDLLRLAAEAGEEYLVGGNTTHRNRTNEITARFEDGHHRPKLSSGRLRSTWVVTHLTMGTRLPELLAAAGTKRIETFDTLLDYVPSLGGTAAAEMLRGSS